MYDNDRDTVLCDYNIGVSMVLITAGSLPFININQSAKPVISSAPSTALMLKTPPVNELIAEP